MGMNCNACIWKERMNEALEVTHEVGVAFGMIA
jgi:hypothetical protein